MAARILRIQRVCFLADLNFGELALAGAASGATLKFS
jgi:hypothetical protein